MVTTAKQDSAILALIQQGVEPQVIYEALWPGPEKPFDYLTFCKLATALDVAATTAIPDEELPETLEDIVADLTQARRCIMDYLNSSSGDFDRNVHDALCKNADVTLKYQHARQERQAHTLNLRATSAKWRLELTQIADGKSS